MVGGTRRAASEMVSRRTSTGGSDFAFECCGRRSQEEQSTARRSEPEPGRERELELESGETAGVPEKSSSGAERAGRAEEVTAGPAVSCRSTGEGLYGQGSGGSEPVQTYSVAETGVTRSHTVQPDDHNGSSRRLPGP